MQKGSRYKEVTEELNNRLATLLDEFSSNTEWTDINNWLGNLQTTLKQYPSPFMTDKILLSKRLNQCINPILPQKLHEQVLNIHEILYYNMRASIDNDINQYSKLFAEELGTYSLSILPYFAHSTVMQHRLQILKLLSDYYLDLGYQLLPMLQGIIKVMLPVYAETNNEILLLKIQDFIEKLVVKSGRRYVISTIWSCVLKFSDCRLAGMGFLAKLIPKMSYRKDEEQFQSSHGFSKQEEELKQQQQLAQMGVQIQIPIPEHPKRPKSVHSNEEKRMPFQFQSEKEFTFSQMQLPQYITKRQPSQRQNSQKRRVKRSQTMVLPINQYLDQAITPEKLDGRKNLEQFEDAINQKGQDSQNDQKLKVSGDQSLNSKNSDKRRNSQGSKKFKNQKSAGFKLDKVPLMELPGIENIKQIGQAIVEENNFPRHNTLVVNAIISCLDDPSAFIKRSALDFMFTHLRLKSEILDGEDRKLLTEAIVRLFRKNQMSIVKRVDRWLFGRENQSGEYEITQKNQFVLPLITTAFSNILSKQPLSEELSILPIKIVQNFYTQHENMISRTIGEIFMVLIRYIFNYGQGFQFSGEILKAGSRFFCNIPSHYPLLFTSIGKALLASIKEGDDHLAYQCVRYIDYCYTKLMKHEHGIEQLEYITTTLLLLSQALKLMTKSHQGAPLYKTYLRDLNLLIFNLISRRESVQRFMKKERQETDKKFLAESGMLELPPERLSYQQAVKEAEQKQRQTYSDILSNMEVFYVQLGDLIRKSANVGIYEDIYRLISLSMIKILSHLPNSIKIKQLPPWFSAIEYGIRVSSPSISLAAIDSLIKCLLYADQHPIYEQFKIFIMHDKSKKYGNDYQNLALQKLWALLDYPHMHSKILDLIVAFSKFFPYQFTQTVHRSFETHSDPEKQASIQRFSHFWRLTGFKYKDLLISNREFVELNKVGLFKMLDFLEDSNPLVRHAAKNWMIESLPLFHRVIQPLFYELMKAAGDWYVTPKKLIVIKEVYDTKMIFNTFRRIRCLLSSGTYSFLKYVYQKPISDSLEELRERVTHISERILVEDQNSVESSQRREKGNDQPDRVEGGRLTYIDILVVLSVRYVQGYTLESMGIDFYTGNTAVNTSAIELLQSLISYIDSPNICYHLIQYILPPLSSALSHSVANQEFITQIQLLNLFKTIFFNSAFRKKGTSQQVRTFFSNIFTKTIFIASMLNGLKTHFPYVRSQFVNFITSCIELIANFLEPDQCTKCIKQILLTYYKIIKKIRIRLIEQVLDEEVHKNEKIDNQFSKEKSKNKVLLTKIMSLEIRAMQEEKITKISNSIQEVARTNEILSILHGVSAILNYFFDLDKMSIQDMKFSFQSSFSFLDSFKSIFTLGLMSSKKSGRLAEKTQFLHNLETCQSILQDLSPVYETILRAWPLSEEFVRIATEQFSSIGSRTFNFEKFGRYNKVLKDLIGFVSTQKQSVWGKIFSILQPMFYRFPRQIMDIYLHLWVKSCTDSTEGKQSSQNPVESIGANVGDTQFLMKNIETIVVSNFPIHIIVTAFLESSLIEEIRQYYQELKAEKRQSLNFRISQLEAKLLYFLYVYFAYNHIDEQSLNKQKLGEIWGNILKSVQPFKQSKSPSTALWMLDFLNMCAVKYSPKEILNHEKFKTELHSLLNSQLKFIAFIASKKEVLFYDEPIKLLSSDGAENTSRYRVVLPIPPTIFQIYKTGRNQRKQTDNCLFQTVKAGDFIHLQKINRLWCFRFLRKLGFEILQNTYLGQKMHFAVIRACEWMEIILPTIEDKSCENMIFAESASQVLYQLMEQSRLLFIKPLKASIFKIFDKDDFFICNKNTLRYWAQIIDWIVSLEKNNETFSYYLEKARLSNSYFTSATTENKNRIKSFERICFILYSGAQDKYAHKIKGLLQKIADVIKQAEVCHPGLLILVLFSIRILILRLSEISLNQLFIDIWPMILAFLMQIFSKKLVKVEIANQISKNPNLLLASLKLIEMISISNLSEFAHHQWIFVYDYFGVKLSLMQTTSELSEIFSQRPELTQLATFSRSQVNSPFLYKPYMLNEIPQHSFSIQGEKKQEKLEYKAMRRTVVIKQPSVGSQDSLKSYGYLLAQNLASLNEYRMQVDLKEVEEVIINDFISLDSFIFKP